MIDRVRTFIGKTRQRGPTYVRDLARYHARAARYQLGILSHYAGTSEKKQAPAFHFSSSDVPAIVAVVPASIQKGILSEANQYLEQRFCFRDLPEIHFPAAIDWNLAPEGNTSWSWDLNRHRFFLTLGTAHHYAASASYRGEYRDKLISLWHNWMRRNPVGKGPNWSSPFEVAARLRNWTWAYFLLAASSGVSPLFLIKAMHGLHEHAEYLFSHLEFHWPNNHLLLEALSLYESAVIFQHHGGQRHMQLASRVLKEQVERQILGDGVHSELCPMYHDIAASELGAFTLLCRRLGHSLPLAMEERIFSMKRFSAALRRTDGSVPLLGDSSYPDTCFRFDASLPACSDLTYWLRHDKAAASLSSVETKRELSLDLFAEAGYGILQSSAQKAHLTFDFGAFSRCATANHGHSDALSFELHAVGRPWIIDSGFFHPWNKSGGPLSPQNSEPIDCGKWARYFRSTAAHNALVIDAQEQNEFYKHNDIGGRATARLNSYRSNSSEVAISGQVEPHWSSGQAVHMRDCSLSKNGGVTVRDQVTGTAAHQLQWLLHFAPDLDVQLRNPATLVAQSQGNVLVCQLRCSGVLPHLRLVRGERSPLQGWVAQSSARVLPAWVLVADVSAALPYEISFHIQITSLTTRGQAIGLHKDLDRVFSELVEVCA